MTANKKSVASLFLIMVICLFSYCGYIFFETVAAVCLLYLCTKSLYRLLIYNFATDEALFRYEHNLALKSKLFPEDVFFVRMKNIFFYLLFIIYFSGEIVFAPNIYIRIFAAAALFMWLFDFGKTIASYAKKYDYTHCFCDSVLEFLMWVQIILSIALAAFKLITV